jgi:glycosyltransferase involved in cell wall biosynthesis
VTPDGTARKLIAAMGGLVADPAAPDEIAAALERAMALVERDRDADWGDETVRRRFDSATVAAEFERIVERVRGGA